MTGFAESYRYTPTCVGKTDPAVGVSFANAGTPPRVWGKRIGNYGLYLTVRYTPTCVGKTLIKKPPYLEI